MALRGLLAHPILGHPELPIGMKGTAQPMAESYPHDEYTRFGGLQMHIRNWGGDGSPVVLLHGLASTCRIWDLTAPILARDFSVIAVDQRGHGDSGKPEDGYEFTSVGNDVAALLGRAAASSAQYWWATRGAPTWHWKCPLPSQTCFRASCSSTAAPSSPRHGTTPWMTPWSRWRPPTSGG